MLMVFYNTDTCIGGIKKVSVKKCYIIIISLYVTLRICKLSFLKCNVGYFFELILIKIKSLF